jgi:hypothetical protein
VENSKGKGEFPTLPSALRQPYDLVLARLPKRTREKLGAIAAKAPAKRKR